MGSTGVRNSRGGFRAELGIHFWRGHGGEKGWLQELFGTA